MPSRIGRDIAETELFADLLHALVDRTGQVLGFILTGYRIFFTGQDWENKRVGVWCLPPAVDNSLHWRR